MCSGVGCCCGDFLCSGAGKLEKLSVASVESFFAALTKVPPAYRYLAEENMFAATSSESVARVRCHRHHYERL